MRRAGGAVSRNPRAQRSTNSGSRSIHEPRSQSMKSLRFSHQLLRTTIAVLFVTPLGASLRAQDFTNHIYQLVSGSFSWHQAKADAEARGGHLATITSQAEYDHIVSLGLLPGPSGYWLGATDEASEGVWQWITGEPSVFHRWRSGEPINAGSAEHFLIGDFSIGDQWNDVVAMATPTIPFYLLEIGHCSPHKARAIPQVVNGFVVGATITDAGCGYSNAPAVLIQGGGGTGATARATVLDGRVSAITIVSAGCCYTNAPQIVIGSPPFVPTLAIRTSKVKVQQSVVLGRRYVLDSSSDLVVWAPTGPPFTADSESIENEFDVSVTGRFFRIREAP